MDPTNTGCGDYESTVTAVYYAKSCERMDEVGDDRVTLTVTSPPYWKAIDYDRHAKNPRRHYRTSEYARGFDDYPSYLDWLTRVFDEVMKKTRPGGFLAIVVGTVLCDRISYPVPFDIAVRLVSCGWAFHQDIVWHKSTGGVKRAGVFIKQPYPGYYYPNIMTEYILIFRRPGPPIYRGVDAERRKSAAFDIGALYTKEIANNIWHVPPVPPRSIKHPCPFPEEIPHRLISLYSYPGDVVLDPFLGSGQTGKVAYALGRSVIGYDTVGEYVRYAYARLEEPLRLRPLQLVSSYDHVPLDAPLGYGGRSGVGRTRHGSGTPSRGRARADREER